MTVLISDDGKPPKQTKMNITVNVPRDLSRPTLNLPETATINEGDDPGTLVHDVTVNDADRQVCLAC